MKMTSALTCIMRLSKRQLRKRCLSGVARIRFGEFIQSVGGRGKRQGQARVPVIAAQYSRRVAEIHAKPARVLANISCPGRDFSYLYGLSLCLNAGSITKLPARSSLGTGRVRWPVKKDDAPSRFQRPFLRCSSVATDSGVALRWRYFWRSRSRSPMASRARRVASRPVRRAASIARSHRCARSPALRLFCFFAIAVS